MESRLEDRLAINDVVVALARAQDDRDWAVITRIFDRAVALDLGCGRRSPASTGPSTRRPTS
jgi:hypothetical protein